MAKIPAPPRILATVIDAGREPFLPRYCYVCGEAESEEARLVIECMAPLSVGDYIDLSLRPGEPPARRRVREVVFREIETRGLGSNMFAPCLVFD